MFLQVFIKDSHTFHATIRELKEQCTIRTDVRHVIMSEEGDEWYFSLDVDLNVEQIKATLNRSGFAGDMLNVNGVREQPNASFITTSKDGTKITEYSISLLTFQQGKLTCIVHPLGTWHTSRKQNDPLYIVQDSGTTEG